MRKTLVRVCHGKAKRPAVSLAETLVCVLLVSGVFVAAVNTTGASVAARQNSSDTRRGEALAQSLMYEILQHPYSDPELTVPPYGTDVGEVLGCRMAFDDIDDYVEWTASPPQTKDGTTLDEFTGWRHTVAVDLVKASNTNANSLTDQGVKRITVTVYRNNVPVANLVAIKTGKPGSTLAPAEQ